MHNKLINLMLTAALVAGLSLSVASCKDDDDDSLSPEEQAEKTAAEQQEKAAKFWNVADQLVGSVNTPDDYENRTFAPTIGEAVGGNETVRRVLTSDLETAAQRFCHLAGIDETTVTTETASYTWSDPDVGTLTYTKTDGSTSLATVDVSIRQIPALRQIVYLTEEQAGANAGDPTNSYYHFGDVISRVRPEDKVKEFWVCVRPAFEPQGKKESHWVSLSPLPKDKLLEYTASNKETYTLPKNLGENEEHTQNLAEMLFALLDPEKWEQNIIDNPKTGLFNKGIPMFHDLDKGKITYLSNLFWKRVVTGWDENEYFLSDGTCTTLWNAVFGNTKSMLFQTHVEGGYPLHLIYGSAKWSTWSSNSPSITAVSYSNGQGKQSNMHKKEKKTYSSQVIYKNDHSKDIVIDFKKDYTELTPHFSSLEFFGTNETFRVVRHATGTELAKMNNAAYSPKSYITGFQEEFCYTNYYKLSVTSECETRQHILASQATEKEALKEPVVGCLIGEDGKFYAKSANARNAGTKGVAMVVYVGEKGSVETGTNYRGLAMSYEDLKGTWSQSDDDVCATSKVSAKDFDACKKALDGIAATKAQAEGCGALKHVHGAAKACAARTLIPMENRRANNLSDWFLPSIGQWMLALQGLGVNLDKKQDYYVPEWKYSFDFGDVKFDFRGEYYWTSTQDTENMKAIFVNTDGDIFFRATSKVAENDVRPFIAF